jgi:hypothetical protein
LEVVEPRESLALTFPDTCIGSSSPPQPVTIQNCGTVPLTLRADGTVMGDHPDDFTSDTCRPTPGMIARGEDRQLAAGETCRLGVTFRPTGPGARTAFVEITSDDPRRRRLVVNLSGTGLGGMINAPDEVRFRLIFIGDCRGEADVVIRNDGCGDLVITRYFIDNANFVFPTPPTVPDTLRSGDTRTRTVRYCTRDFATLREDGTLQITVMNDSMTSTKLIRLVSPFSP